MMEVQIANTIMEAISLLERAARTMRGRAKGINDVLYSDAAHIDLRLPAIREAHEALREGGK